MTQEEFNQAQANGQVNVNPPQPIPDPIPEEKSFDENSALLSSLKRPRRALTTAPTFTPKTFAESIQFVDDGTTKKTYFYINGAWVTAGASSLVYWLLGTFIGATTTAYYCLGTYSGTESSAQLVVPASGTISNVYIATTTAQPGSGSSVLTFRKNGVDQAVTITIAAGAAAGIYSDTTHSFQVTAGDLIDIKWVNNASGNSASILQTAFKFTS